MENELVNIQFVNEKWSIEICDVCLTPEGRTETELQHMTCGQMLLDPGPNRSSTVLLTWGDEVLQQLRWNGSWMTMSLRSQTAKVLPMKTRKGIRYRISDSRNMLGRELKTKTGSCQQQGTQQMHKTWHFRCPRIQNVHHTVVVRSKQTMLPVPKVAPNMSRDDHWKEFPISNGLFSL